MPSPVKNSKEQGFFHILILAGITITVIIIAIIVSANIKTTQELSQKNPQVKGVLIAKGGDDGSSSGSGDSGGSSGSSSSSGSGSSGSASSDSSSSSTSGSGSSGSSSNSGSGSSTSGSTSTSGNSTTTKTESQIKPQTVSSTSPTIKVKTESSLEKQKTEVKFSETEKVKTRVENDKTRIDVYSGGIKVRYEWRNDRFVIKVENEAGDEVNAPETEILKIDERLNSSGIKVATEGGKLMLARNNIGAVSNFPFQINLDTNELIASTSAGTKVLTILPDQAVTNMLAANVISKLTSNQISNQTLSGNLTSVKDIVTLGERNGLPVYEISGLKEQKLLGFIPVSTETKIFVSAETGQPVAKEQSLLANIIDTLSF